MGTELEQVSSLAFCYSSKYFITPVLWDNQLSAASSLEHSYIFSSSFSVCERFGSGIEQQGKELAIFGQTEEKAIFC